MRLVEGLVREFTTLSSRFVASISGNFALTMALLAPIILGTIGGGVDILILENHRSQLQDTADFSALAAAREASLKGWSKVSAEEVATVFVKSNLSNRFSDATFDYTTAVDEKARRVTVTLMQDHYRYFVIGYFTGSPQISVTSTARQSGQETICIIAQAPTGGDVLKLEGDAKVSALGCSAYVGSTDSKGLTVKDQSKLTTKMSCTVGGFKGSIINYAPMPISDCPPISDPLIDRGRAIDASLASHCDWYKFEVKKSVTSLSPGTYCQGLKISGGSKVQFSPGIYIIQDGEFLVDGKSSIVGSGVAFIFAGEKAKLNFKNDSSVSLSAPIEGLLSGILFYAKPTGLTAREFKIQSRDAGRLIGTVYLPNDDLTVG